MAEAGTARLPDAELVMLPECGHFVQFEQADAANRAMLAFIAR